MRVIISVIFINLIIINAVIAADCHSMEEAARNGNLQELKKIIMHAIDNKTTYNLTELLGNSLIAAARNDQRESMEVILKYVQHSELYLYWHGYINPMSSYPILLTEDQILTALDEAKRTASYRALQLLESLSGQLQVKPSPTSYFTWTTIKF